MDTLTHSMNNLTISTKSNSVSWADDLVSGMNNLQISKKRKLYSDEELNNLGPIGDIVRKIYASHEPCDKIDYVYSKSKCGKYIYKRVKK